MFFFLQGVVRKWTDRYLYLGKNFDDPPTFYHPSVVKPQVSQFVKHKPVVNFCVSSTKTNDSLAKEIHIGDSYSINRFGLGIKEGCSTGLFLPAEDYIVPRRFSYLTDPVKTKLFRKMPNQKNSLQVYMMKTI